MKVHNNLKIILKNRGMTGRQVSRDTEISHSTISQIINGRIAPHDWELEKICEATGATESQIYPDDCLREALAE
jgi:transcriptional regulator with XRE-family HTH domain